MTALLYGIQNSAVRFCVDADESFREGSIEGRVTGATLSLVARATSLFAGLVAFANIGKSPVKLVGRIVTIVDDDISVQTVLRIAITVSSIAVLIIGRLAVSMGGVIVPELVYGVFKMHEHLLWIGLYCRAQSHVFREGFAPERGCLEDQRLRMNIVNAAIDLIEGANRTDPDGAEYWGRFNDRIWQPAIRRVEGRGDVEEVDVMPGLMALLPGDFPPIAALPPEFLEPVEVPQPSPQNVPAFYRQFAQSMHAAVIRLEQGKIFTREELEDGTTALYAAMNLGLLDLVKNHCSLRGERVEFDHQELTETSAGSLFVGDGLKRLAQARKSYEGIPQDQESVAWEYCCDKGTVASGKMKEFFEALVSFRGCVERDMQAYSKLFCGVFTVPR